jgi:hypothetical protein
LTGYGKYEKVEATKPKRKQEKGGTNWGKHKKTIQQNSNVFVAVVLQETICYGVQNVADILSGCAHKA